MAKVPIKFYELSLLLRDYCSAIQSEDERSITINFIKGDTWDDDNIFPFEGKKISGDTICKHCGKPLICHFHKFKTEYNKGLRDRYYCTKSGIVQFVVSEDRE